MKEGIIVVKSESDSGLVISVPSLMFKKVWERRGAKLMVDRDKLEEAYFASPSVDYLFRHGLLVTDDKQFLEDVGLISGEEVETVKIMADPLTESDMKLIIGSMTDEAAADRMSTLSKPQLADLAEYAIEHGSEMTFSRMELITKYTGKNVTKSYENSK